MSYQDEIKAIKLLQDKAKAVDNSHKETYSDLESIKAMLREQCNIEEIKASDEFKQDKANILNDMTSTKPLEHVSTTQIYAEAHQAYQADLSLGAILTAEELVHSNEKYNLYLQDFNKRYSLDAWDYAIACSCGLFAGMLDMFFVSAPPKPTVSYSQKVDGVFNQWVQGAFNKLIPPELSEALSKGNTIGAPDASTVTQLINAPKKALAPLNHRLRALSHDPILGLIFGVWDMMHGTCTMVNNGKIISVPGKAGSTEGDIFQLIGRMFGHLLSDVNAASAKGNRGMGLPAPFMGILRMFEGIPIGDSNFGKQIEWMYVKGYDFRQFIVTSIPMTIMEVLLRVFYTIKQMSVHGAQFGETMLDTMPLNLNPRFRMMLALAYGTSTSVNAGKMYVTKNILNANYASWMGFAWNSFHSLKWIAWDKHNKLWDGILDAEIKEIEQLSLKLEALGERVTTLPI